MSSDVKNNEKTQNKKAHRWTNDELEQLTKVVNDSDALRLHYERQGYPTSAYWDAVAGMVFHVLGLTVTGKACRRQWDFLLRRKASVKDADGQDTLDLKHALQVFSDRLDQLERALSNVGKKNN